MTSQSRAWAEEQRDVPGDAWRVLYALANYANHRTGKIHFDPDEIVEEACIELKSLPKYLGALRRNGYLAIDGKDKDKHYFLLIGRDTSQKWDWNAKEPAEENDAVPSARPAPDLVPASFSAAAQAKARGMVKPIPCDGYHIFRDSKADDAFRAHYRSKGEKFRPECKLTPDANGVHRWAYVMPIPWPVKEEEQQIAV